MKKIRITALGDSLTKGVVLTDNKYSVTDNNFIDILSRELDLRIDNYGRFGCTVEYGQSVLEKHIEDVSISDYTFIEYGGNDCDFDWNRIAEAPDYEHQPKTSLKTFKEIFTKLIQRIIDLGSKPVILTLPPIDSELYFSFFTRFMNDDQKENVRKWLGGDINIINNWHETYNDALHEISSETNTQIIDLTLPFKTEKGNIREYLCTDGIHPNSKGHELIATTIVNQYL